MVCFGPGLVGKCFSGAEMREEVAVGGEDVELIGGRGLSLLGVSMFWERGTCPRLTSPPNGRALV